MNPYPLVVRPSVRHAYAHCLEDRPQVALAATVKQACDPAHALQLMRERLKLANTTSYPGTVLILACLR